MPELNVFYAKESGCTKCTDLIVADLGDGSITMTCFCHISCCLSYVRCLAASLSFSAINAPTYIARVFSGINI